MPAKGVCGGATLDRLFTYAVPRTVTIQDARLGVSYRLAQFGIFLFIILAQLLYSGGHIEFEAPFGLATFQVKRPTSGVPLSGGNSYWNLSDDSRTNANASLSRTHDLAYCRNLTHPHKFCSDDPQNTSFYCAPGSCPDCKAPALPLRLLECRYVDEELIAPIVDDHSIMIITRVSWMFQDLVCEKAPDDLTPCQNLMHAQTKTQKYFTVEPERFEIMFDHQAFTPTNGVTGAQMDASDAELRFTDGRTYWPAKVGDNFYRSDEKPWIPGYYEINGRHSISVATLLEAAGLKLDDAATGLFDSGSTHRYTGITVLLRVSYTNYEPYDFIPGSFQYSYSAAVGTTYSAVHVVTWNGERRSDGSRLFENRHGVRIVITQDGKLGAFTLVNCMLFVGGAVATFALASIVVDNVVLRFFVSPNTRRILKLASQTTTPVRAELTDYFKAVEEETQKPYEAPTSFWAVEKELNEFEAARSPPSKRRPTFAQSGAMELNVMLNKERDREGGGDERKLAVLSGAVGFAEGLQGSGNSPEARARARKRWATARVAILIPIRQRRMAERAQKKRPAEKERKTTSWGRKGPLSVPLLEDG